MNEVVLGKTGIRSDKVAFGALPVQRVGMEEAVRLLKRAAANGITYFDTARMYSDSEEKLGRAFAGQRDGLVIATKTMAKTGADFQKDLDLSLENLGTDRIDLYQFHNPPFVPKPGDGSGLYEAMLEAREQGKIRHIGITNHRLDLAFEAVESGLYETLQFPFSYLAGEQEVRLVRLCEEKQVGFIAMKALSGGLITCVSAAYAWLDQYKNVLPIWGIQHEWELDAILSCKQNPPVLDRSLREIAERDRAALEGEFCRGCGYCMPCPADIKINDCARMSLLLRRAPASQFLTEEYQAEMRKIENCLECGQCREKCPYGLDTPSLLRKNLKDYEEILAGRESG